MKWSKLNESSYDGWLQELPGQSGEELILQMIMLVMEDPPDAAVAIGRVEELVQQVLRINGVGEKIGATTVEW